MSFEYEPGRGRETAERADLIPALLAGLGAALVGSIGWVLVMALTGYEIGFAAWGLGALVGFAMQRTTSLRGPAVGASAAGLALVGLLMARVLIGEFLLTGLTEKEVLADDALMMQAAVLDLQFSDGFPDELQSEYAALAESDTISDAMWDQMLLAGQAHLEGLPESGRARIAGQFSGLALQQIGIAGRVTAQFGLYDLLWVLLAVSTAWSMLKKPEEQPELGSVRT